MSEKRYQISPIELVEWAEPLFGDDGMAAVLFKKDKTAGRGFSEKQIASFEEAAGIRFPSALREYYLVCGKASLNYGSNPMLIPAKDAKKGEDNVVFSYDYIKEELQWLKDHGETGYEDQEQLRVLPVEKWNEIVGNYLLIWVENQGCWFAGIRAEDLDKPNPPVYYNDEDDMYHWAPFGDSVQSFILARLLGNYCFRSVYGETVEDPKEIQRILEENGVDFQRLQESYPFPGGRFCHTCLDTDTDTLYVYGEEAENRSAYLRIICAE